MTHEEKIRIISDSLRQAGSQGQTLTFAKKSVSHFVPLPDEKKQKTAKLDLKSLDSILEINVKEKYCVAESGVTFSDLVRETLKHNLVPCTVPELKTITIGGAVSGCSIESMSYKYGGFHDSCLEYEVIKGDGDVISCSREQNAGIFEMMHGSYGTLGIISKIKFKLHPAKPYVHMTYKTFPGFAPYWSFLKEECLKGNFDFIDSIIHAKNRFVVCLGNFTDTAPRTSSYDWLRVFYKSTAKMKEDWMDTYRYFFRYDSDCHWLTKTLPLMETVPARFLLGKFVLGSTNLIKWSKRLKSVLKLKGRPDIVVDVFIPSRNFESFYEWYESDFDFYPLWIVPYKAPRTYPWISDSHAARMNDNFFIDCAIYGKANNKPGKDYADLLEKEVYRFDGIKTLISRNNYDAGTFWKIYSRERYEKIKAETDPGNVFGELYDRMGKR